VKLKHKYLLLSVLFMAFPLLASLLFTYNEIQKQYRGEIITSHLQLMNQLNRNIQYSVNELDNKLMSIYETSDVYDYLINLTDNNTISPERQQRMENLLKVLTLSMKGFSNVYLYLDAKQYLYRVDYLNLGLLNSFTYKDRIWLNEVEQGGGAMTIHTSSSEDVNEVFIGRAISDVIQKKKVGVLGLGLNKKFFVDLFGEDYANDYIQVNDSRGNVIYETRKLDLPKDLVYVIKSEKNKYGWFVVKYIPQSIVKMTAWNSIKFTIYLGVGVLIVGIGLWLLFARRFYRPIVSLAQTMKNVGNGNFKLDIADPINDRQDEIGFLSRQFHAMVTKLEAMIQNEYELKLRESYSRVKALQAQINPHFLYNTLTSMYSEALDAGATSICSMIKSLSSIFRYTIESGHDLVPLSREIEHVRHYLQIQKYRFEEKLSFHIAIDESLMDVPCVKLSLQPIVENAILHGITKKGRGALTITAKKEEGQIMIMITDTGCGILPERLTALQLGLNANASEDNHIGLSNVQQRVMHFFKDSTGIQLQSQFGEGTEVSVIWRVE